MLTVQNLCYLDSPDRDLISATLPVFHAKDTICITPPQ